VSRLINNEEIRSTIEGAAGRDMYKELNPWLANIAGERSKEPASYVEGLLAKARMGATVVNLGWKFSTGLMQSTSYLVSVKELGPEYAAKGLKEALGKPFEIQQKYDFVAERSELMRTRTKNYDRDVRDFKKRIGMGGKGPFDVLPPEITDSWFLTTGYMDLAVSLPTWLGAYSKAMDGHLENIPKGDEISAIDYADRTVRTTQGSGAPKDLSGIQRGSELLKNFTMFYNWSNVIFNQMKRSGDQYSFDKNMPKLVASLALLWFAPAVLDNLIVGRSPDLDDSSEDWKKWAAKKEIMYPFQTVVFLRDIVNGMDQYGYSPSPAFDAYEQLGRTGKIGLNLMTGDKEELKRADYKAMVQTTGYFTALPTRQIWLSGEYFYDWITGQEEPKNAAEGIWRTLVTGKKKK
jgi:hypothetical protein